jgi:hypothetical protein
MSTQPPVKSIGEAINDFTEEDVVEVADESKDNTDVDEGTPVGADEDEDSEEGLLEDDDEDEGEETDDEGEEEETDEADEDEDEEGDFPQEQPAGEEDEEEGEGEEEEGVEAAPGEVDIVDHLTPEDMSLLKGTPVLQKIRKLLLRGYNDKMKGKDQILKLGEAYSRDPIGVIQALARSQNLQVLSPETPETPKEATQEDKLRAAQEKVEKLFGEKVGPQVREALQELNEAIAGAATAPLRDGLGRVINDTEQARMQAAEVEWRARNKDVLTPDLEKAVIELGNSGRYVPGPNVAPGEYLDDLLDIARAKYGKKEVKKARSEGSRRLARRIAKNKRDREPSGVTSKAKVKSVSRLESKPESFKSISEALDVADSELSGEE